MNIRGLLLFSLAVLILSNLPQSIYAQSAPSPRDRVDYDLKFLASDELEGREPGSKGIEMAADYIIDQFKQYGLKSGTEDGSYRQVFTIRMESFPNKEESHLTLSGPDDQTVQLVIGENAQPQMTGGSGSAESAELVFVGYGITADELNYLDYRDIDVNGKVVVMLRMEPQRNDPESVFDGSDNSKYAYIAQKITTAKENGAAGMILVNDRHTAPNKDQDQLALPDEFGRDGKNMAFYHVKRAVIDDVLSKSPLLAPNGEKLTSLKDIETRIDETLEPLSQPIAGWKASINTTISDRVVETSNIVGVIEGEGPKADETIVIGGHYDHLGYGGRGSAAPGRHEIHNGADDNATGTAGVVELARRFGTNGKKPPRRLVFIAFSGEERGLLGAAHYTDKEPLFPLESTVAMVNFDMIGRLRNDKLTVYGTGTAKAFDIACEAANLEDEPISLNKVPSPFAGSDHMKFVQKQIPVVFLHTGLTNIYHTPEDDYETLNVDGTVRVIDYTERLIQNLAEASDEDLAFVEIARSPRRRPSYLGVRMDYDGDERGIFVEDVSEGSPAEQAGIQKGDVITAMNGTNYTDRGEVIKFLTENRPGTEIEVTLLRGDEEMTVKVSLTRTPRRSRRSGSGQ